MQSVTFFKRDVDSKDVIARLDNITEYEYNIITEKIKDGLKEENINVVFEKGNMLDKSDIVKKTKAIEKVSKSIHSKSLSLDVPTTEMIKSDKIHGEEDDGLLLEIFVEYNDELSVGDKIRIVCNGLYTYYCKFGRLI